MKWKFGPYTEVLVRHGHQCAIQETKFIAFQLTLTFKL